MTALAGRAAGFMPADRSAGINPAARKSERTMIRLLIVWIHDLYRYLQLREERAHDEEEDDLIRREHRERLRGIPPHLRSTRFVRRRRARSDSELLLISIALVGIPGVLLFLLMFIFCLLYLP
jgi:hypothetical protein